MKKGIRSAYRLLITTGRILTQLKTLNVGGHHPSDDIERKLDIGENGNKVLSLLVDGQGTKYKGSTGQDVCLLVHVNEAKKTMNFVYYSPEQDKAWNIQNQFQYSFADANNPAIGA